MRRHSKNLRANLRANSIKTGRVSLAIDSGRQSLTRQAQRKRARVAESRQSPWATPRSLLEAGVRLSLLPLFFSIVIITPFMPPDPTAATDCMAGDTSWRCADPISIPFIALLVLFLSIVVGAWMWAVSIAVKRHPRYTDTWKWWLWCKIGPRLPLRNSSAARAIGVPPAVVWALDGAFFTFALIAVLVLVSTA